MILEAFSQYLHNAAPELAAGHVLSTWLWDRLKEAPKNNVDQVIQLEVGIARTASERSGAHPRSIRLPADTELALNMHGRYLQERPKGKGKARPDPAYYFKGTSASGTRLLNSLYEYAMSYEQVKWSRFVHSVKASDFRLPD